MSTPLWLHDSSAGFLLSLAISLALILPLNIRAHSQQRPERTIDEIKTEAIHRAEVDSTRSSDLILRTSKKPSTPSTLAIKTNGRRLLWEWPIVT